MSKRYQPADLAVISEQNYRMRMSKRIDIVASKVARYVEQHISVEQFLRLVRTREPRLYMEISASVSLWENHQ